MNVVSPANTTPLLKDVCQYITPQYAADWKVIGTLLDLPTGELKTIEAGWPTNVKWCCNQMLEKWLEMDITASWRKLLTVIESPAVSGHEQGTYASRATECWSICQHLFCMYTYKHTHAHTLT